jgi:hypothetical protein
VPDVRLDVPEASIVSYQGMSGWEWVMPTRSEYIAIVRKAAKGTSLPAPVKRKLTLYAKQTPCAVFGKDYWAGSCCPLRAIGVDRNQHGAWLVDGARDFEKRYDVAMYLRTLLPGPCLVSVKGDKNG